MANVGLKSFLFGKLTEGEDETATYAAPSKLAGAIEMKVSAETNSAELYSDDALSDSDYSIAKGTVTAGIDDDDDSVFGPLLGKTEHEIQVSGKTLKEYIGSNSDEAQYVGFGYIIPKNHGRYKVQFFKKVKFKAFYADAKTHGEKLEYTTPSVEGTFSTLADGTYERTATFDDLETAKAYLNGCFTGEGITEVTETTESDS